MKQLQYVDIYDHGHCVEITVQIPWSAFAGNAWDFKFKKNDNNRKALQKAANEAQRREVIQTYEKLQSISKTAKACGMVYFLTRQIIQNEAARRRQQERQEMIESARRLARSGAPIQDIATTFGKSPQTIRRWLRNHPTVTDLAEQGQRRKAALVLDAR